MNDKLFYEEVADGTEHVSSGRTVTEADVVNFAGLSADFNNMHIDEEFAKKHCFQNTCCTWNVCCFYRHRSLVYYAKACNYSFYGAFRMEILKMQFFLVILLK
jgi:hypothetical protein